MDNFTVAITDGSYMFRLQRSHQQAVYIRNIKWDDVLVVYI